MKKIVFLLLMSFSMLWAKNIAYETSTPIPKRCPFCGLSWLNGEEYGSIDTVFILPMDSIGAPWDTLANILLDGDEEGEYFNQIGYHLSCQSQGKCVGLYLSSYAYLDSLEFRKYVSGLRKEISKEQSNLLKFLKYISHWRKKLRARAKKEE